MIVLHRCDVVRVTHACSQNLMKNRRMLWRLGVGGLFIALGLGLLQYDVGTFIFRASSRTFEEKRLPVFHGDDMAAVFASQTPGLLQGSPASVWPALKLWNFTYLVSKVCRTCRFLRSLVACQQKFLKPGAVREKRTPCSLWTVHVS
jgi:hypothetical protein